jgi:rsbT co-antagonist protein RsbR
MMHENDGRFVQLIRDHQDRLLRDWLEFQTQSGASRRDLISDTDLQRQSREFLSGFVQAASQAGLSDVHSAAWSPVRETITRLAQVRAQIGFSPGETMAFLFSLRQPLFNLLRGNVQDAADFAAAAGQFTHVLDALGLLAVEQFQKVREEVISRQQQEMLELSTPVVTLWQGILALPLIGTLDSARTQVVMESLLQRIVDTGSQIAILDITGVPTVDTLVAQHLLKTVAAARLMGADCIISGIRPQIAQTIVHLGVELNAVTTKATLADAFAVALKRTGLTVARSATAAASPAAPAPAPGS